MTLRTHARLESIGADTNAPQRRASRRRPYAFPLRAVLTLLLAAVGGMTTAAQNRPSAALAPQLSQASDTTPAISERYRLSAGDVLQIAFPYIPEFDQTVAVMPDGYVSLRGIREVLARGRTVPEFRAALLAEYESILREPTATVVLKDFEKPFFIAAGEIAHPGKFELRSATTVTQALAIAGGVTKAAKSSQIVIFRRVTDELLEVKTLNAKKMLAERNLSEDLLLRPGDTVFVPKRALANLSAFIPQPSLGLYLNPLGALP